MHNYRETKPTVFKKVLGILKSRPLLFIGFTVLLIANLICYNANGRLLYPLTNIVAVGLIIANFHRKQ